MRWDGLFDDLEAQWEAQARRELDAEVADRTRRERAAIGLRERLAAELEGEQGPHDGRGSGIRLSLVDGSGVIGRVDDVGDGWLLVGGSGGSSLVPFSALVAITGLSKFAATTVGLSRSFGFGYALRGLSRDRALVHIVDRTGSTNTGTIDVVGRDLLELSEHPADLARRPENVTARRLVPFAAVAAVRLV
ncbi:MAG TPA: hypothetical protein VGN48_01795 [Pedococcus sp.]|nr:hypothetical protein [Pedococcus sp.]